MMNDPGQLFSNLETVYHDLKLISTDIVVVADWVRFKCRYGCRAYGKHLCCPPFAPTPDETRRLLADYALAVLVRIQASSGHGSTPDQVRSCVRESKAKLQKTVFELERKAFLSGCYKALGMSASPCHLCETCVIEEKLERGETTSQMDAVMCRHKEVMRPSMEACGIDVFKTLENAGYSPRVLRDYSQRVELFGMVLLD